MKDNQSYVLFGIAGASIIIASIAAVLLYGSSSRIDVLEDEISLLKEQLASTQSGRGGITQQSIAKMTGPSLGSMNNEDNIAGSDIIGKRIDTLEKQIDELNYKVENLTNSGN